MKRIGIFSIIGSAAVLVLISSGCPAADNCCSDSHPAASASASSSSGCGGGSCVCGPSSGCGAATAKPASPAQTVVKPAAVRGTSSGAGCSSGGCGGSSGGCGTASAKQAVPAQAVMKPGSACSASSGGCGSSSGGCGSGSQSRTAVVLTPAQQKKLDEIGSKYDVWITRLRDHLAQRRQEMKSLAGDPNSTEEVLRKKMHELANVQAELSLAYLMEQRTKDKVYTPQQKAAVQTGGAEPAGNRTARAGACGGGCGSCGSTTSSPSPAGSTEQLAATHR